MVGRTRREGGGELSGVYESDFKLHSAVPHCNP